VSLPTLEDIFATVTWGSTDIVSGSPKANSSWPSGLHTSQFSKEENTLEIPRSDFVDSGCQALKKARKPNATIIFKIYGLILKRFWNLIGDKWPMVSSFAISFLLMIIAMSIALIRPDSKTPAVLLTPSLYGPGSLSFISTKRMTPVLASLLAPPGIGTTCLLPANFISPHTECVQEISEIQLQKFDQQCQCSDYHWTCIKNQTKKQEIQVQHTNTTDTIYAAEDGSYSYLLAPNTDFEVTVSKDGFFSQSEDVTSMNQSGDITKDFTLEELVKDKSVVIDAADENGVRPILYDFNKWEIRPDAYEPLNKLSKRLKDNPKITIELSSHTDCRGTDSYNQDLSFRRAKSAKNYLISKGVKANRIKVKGYGETKPLNKCVDGVLCTDDEYQANRRTEFKVIEIDK